LKPGDLLLAIRGTYGRVVVVPPELEGGNITQDSARIDLIPGADPRYAKIVLLAPPVQTYFKRVARGVAVKGLNIAEVRTTPVALPPIAEQRRIVERAEDLLSVAEASDLGVVVNLARCTRLRQCILKWAFEGKLTDQDPNDEPASVLLELIKTERERAAATKPAKAFRPPRTSASAPVLRKKQLRA
jgi:type I restriction enzyme S subunit